jgi:hypothetical protein
MPELLRLAGCGPDAVWPSCECPEILNPSQPLDAGAPEVVAPEAAPVLVTKEAVDGYIDIPFKILAKKFKNPDFELQDYEREMFLQPVTDCINKYVPEWLKATDRPELYLLGAVIIAYLMRVGLIDWAQKLWKKAKGDTSEPATETPDSPESSAT